MQADKFHHGSSRQIYSPTPTASFFHPLSHSLPHTSNSHFFQKFATRLHVLTPKFAENGRLEVGSCLRARTVCSTSSLCALTDPTRKEPSRNSVACRKRKVELFVANISAFWVVVTMYE